ncbi:hypothetical protein LTR15_007194 [Elasticomyces elasticus]|nr:hypothetical protein LTR15_007194 [Elasticomyces elasticus]
MYTRRPSSNDRKSTGGRQSEDRNHAKGNPVRPRLDGDDDHQPRRMDRVDRMGRIIDPRTSTSKKERQRSRAYATQAPPSTGPAPSIPFRPGKSQHEELSLVNEQELRRDGIMLEAYRGRADDEITISEGQRFTLVGADDGSGWIRIKPAFLESTAGFVPAALAELSAAPPATQMPVSRRESVPSPPVPPAPLNNSVVRSLLWSEGLHRIIIGVDFGTTYTDTEALQLANPLNDQGVSHVSTAGGLSKGIDDVSCIRTWPGPAKDADYAWKTPSRIAYAKENPKISEDRWGFGVTPKQAAYTWMKLLLDPQRVTKFDDPSLALSEGQGVLRMPPGKTAIDVCTDFLSEVAKFAHSELVKVYGEHVLTVSPLEFWLTIPAVWSDRAKADTLRVFQRAATRTDLFNNAEASTFLIPEPEAAAVAAITDVSKDGSRLQVKPGDSVLVCDCGGGTVDVTTFSIAALEPKLSFEELLVGSGGKCGSTYIDRNFIKWMEKRFGDSYTRLAWDKRGPASIFMKDFESHKRDFGTPRSASDCYEMTLVMDGVQDSKYYETQTSEVKIYE